MIEPLFDKTPVSASLAVWIGLYASSDVPHRAAVKSARLAIRSDVGNPTQSRRRGRPPRTQGTDGPTERRLGAFIRAAITAPADWCHSNASNVRNCGRSGEFVRVAARALPLTSLASEPCVLQGSFLRWHRTFDTRHGQTKGSGNGFFSFEFMVHRQHKAGPSLFSGAR
jgi:hypothetical protein